MVLLSTFTLAAIAEITTGDGEISATIAVLLGLPRPRLDGGVTVTGLC